MSRQQMTDERERQEAEWARHIESVERQYQRQCPPDEPEYADEQQENEE